MSAFLAWYLLITSLGWLTFPVSFRLFPALKDRGFALSRTLGLLIWGYAFWISASLGLAQNDPGGILMAMAVLAGLSLWVVLKMRDAKTTDEDRPSSIFQWLHAHMRYVFAVELLFLTAFGLLAFLRSANPELTTAEKPMELAFINAILRSENFPPHDPWLSGYAISYYYFGYVITAMLARLTGVPGSTAHNLMTALIFGLAAIGSYGILYDLLAQKTTDDPAARQAGRRKTNEEKTSSSTAIKSSFLAPLFLLLVSNLEGLFEVLYRLGIFWPSNPQNTNNNFWTWLDMRELTAPPPQPAAWMPDRYLWWWRASRVVQDYDLAGNFREVIDEFPFFSFLHADLHPHVLAIPFGLLAIAAGLNLFLGGWHGMTRLAGSKVKISPAGFFVSALLLGGLAFLNTWDILIAAALIVSSYLLARARTSGWNWQRLEEGLMLALPLGVLAVTLYIPFYIGFSSQAGGPLPNLINPTRGAHLWVMFGSLLLPIMAWLLYQWLDERERADWKFGISTALGVVLFLWVFSWLLGLLAQLTDPVLARGFLDSQGITNLRSLFLAASARRLSFIGSLITLLLVLIPALAYLIGKNQGRLTLDDRRQTTDDRPQTTENSPLTADNRPQNKDERLSTSNNRSSAFVLLLIILGTLLVLIPEFVYLRDQFGTRLNTVFKFYYQAWILWSLAAAFGTAVLLQNLRGVWDWLYRLGMALLLAAALTYPSLSLLTKTNNFKPMYGFTLDDFERVQRETPDDAAAIRWLQTAPKGVVAEAVGGSYSGFGRVSTYSGLPTVLGWPGHESQWRGGYAEQGTRREDILTLYTTPNWSIAEEIIRKYDIRYIFIGSLERSELIVQEEKFHQQLRVVFQQGNAVIYEAQGSSYPYNFY